MVSSAKQQRARAALRELHTLLPNFGAIAREEFGKWHDAELTEHLLDGLQQGRAEDCWRYLSPCKRYRSDPPDFFAKPMRQIEDPNRIRIDTVPRSLPLARKGSLSLKFLDRRSLCRPRLSSDSKFEIGHVLFHRYRRLLEAPDRRTEGAPRPADENRARDGAGARLDRRTTR